MLSTKNKKVNAIISFIFIFIFIVIVFYLKVLNKKDFLFLGLGAKCIYSGTGNWNVNYSDNCKATTTTYVNGDFNLIYDGPGSFELYSELSADALNCGAGTSIKANNNSAKTNIY